MNVRRTLSTALAVVAVVILSGVAAQGDTRTDGPAVWASPIVTVGVVDAAAWAGADIAAALAQWDGGPVRLVLTDDAAGADVTLEVERAAEMVGATAYMDSRAGVIEGCRVAINAKYVGSKYGTQMLTHELGHCLGLDHSTLAETHEPRAMYWQGGGSFSSATVTEGDLETLRGLYR